MHTSVLEEEATIGVRPWRLPATLTRPAVVRPVAGLVLVHGVGPHDRDASTGWLRPFRDLARGLASRQVAVLRYEKRTYAYPGWARDGASFTVNEEAIVDAVAALTHLRAIATSSFDALFVLGHSGAGALLPRIALQTTGLAGLIALAGSPKPLAEIFLRQIEQWAAASPLIPTGTVLRARRQAAKAMDPLLPLDTPTRDLPLEFPAAYWKDLQDYRPIEVLRSIPEPLLILHAGHDRRVSAADLVAWTEGLRGRRDTTIRVYPKLNHFFVDQLGAESINEGMRPGQVDRAVIDDIAEWIHCRSTARRSGS